MQVFFLTTDLMSSSQVTGVAKHLDIPITVVGSAASLAEAMAGHEEAALVLIDLSAPALDIDGLVSQLRAAASPAVAIAYGPHVHEARLEAARQAGCDEVLSRGQFSSQIERILRQYAL